MRPTTSQSQRRVCPLTSLGTVLNRLVRLHADLFQLFLERFATAHPETLNVLWVDNSRCHTAHTLQLPPNVRLVFQAPSRCGVPDRG